MPKESCQKHLQVEDGAPIKKACGGALLKDQVQVPSGKPWLGTWMVAKFPGFAKLSLWKNQKQDQHLPHTASLLAFYGQK